MKIGEVVNKYQISVNNLYFYINNGLLVPPRRGSQYDFDKRTIEDLEKILELKQMEFPLKTIHRILSLRRISNYSSPEDWEELVSLYRAQESALLTRERTIASARQRLAGALAQMDASASMQFGGALPQTGVPLDMLPLICCPHCKKELLMEGIVMNSHYIFQASLRCDCGYQARIQDGILKTDHKNTSLHDKPDVNRELYKDLPDRTLSLFERSYHWMEERIRRSVRPGQIWMENYPNAWFFFHNHLELLGREDSLIVIDKFPETLESYKELIDRQGPPCNILYIADASETPPLREACVDCSMDFFASNEYNFYRTGFYLSTLKPYLRADARLFGVYFFFRHGKKTLQNLFRDYPESAPESFNERWFLRELRENFTILETDDCGSSDNSGKNLGLGFHEPGEELHLQAYAAQRRG